MLVWFGMLSVSAAANTVHQVRFNQPAKVLVWQAGEFVGEGAEISVLANRDEVHPILPGSGQLLTVGAGEPGPQSIEFSVASNSGFAIISDDPLFATRSQVRMIGVGANAAPAVTRTESSAGVIYRQASRTAQRPGAPETQALVFELSWTTETPPNLEVIALAR
ncbi:MAG: hypothetical protein AAF996_15155 [Pseudomonadota bacterium]